jgi:hypothetical protein
MSMKINLGRNRFAFVLVEATENVQGLGTIHPRVRFELRVHTNRDYNTSAEIHYLRLRVKFKDEVLGEGISHGDLFDVHDRTMHVEVPITRTALEFVNENLQGDRVDLVLSLEGWMRTKYEADDDNLVRDPPPGEWLFATFGENETANIHFQVARSEWFKRVLEPLGSYEYLLTEIPLLKTQLVSSLQPALRQLKEAERYFAQGDDAAVFFYCRGMLEAIPGAPQHIFDSMTDEKKAARLDELALATKRYYDRGRHVATDGEQQGDFAVNHRESLFALNMAKVLLAEISSAVG